MKKHAAIRLIERFDMSIEELKHVLKTGTLIKVPEKEGQVGVIERKLGEGKIRIKFRIHDDILWIITVEGGKRK